MKSSIVLMLALSFSTFSVTYARFYVSVRVGGQNQVNKLEKKHSGSSKKIRLPDNIPNLKEAGFLEDAPDTLGRNDIDAYIDIINKIYASFRNHVHDMKSQNYQLVAPEVMFNTDITSTSGKRIINGRFGVDIKEYLLLGLKKGLVLTNHTPKSEAKITKIFTDMVQYMRQDVPEVKFDYVKSVLIPKHKRYLRVFPVYANYKNTKIKVVYGSGETRNGESFEEIPQAYFANAITLHGYILDRYLGAFVRNYSDVKKEFYEDKIKILQKQNRELQDNVPTQNEIPSPEPSANSKNSKLNMLLEGSVGWNRVTANPKDKFGLYTGIELFFDFNPNENYFGQNRHILKENSVGCSLGIGGASRDSWMLYGITGIKMSFKRFELQEMAFTKHKIEYELGAGTDYIFNKHTMLGVRYVYTFHSTMPLKYNDETNAAIKTRSSKILLSLGYIF